MLWLSFRTFFIESFVRSVLFQIVRNASCYVVYVPLGFGALILLSMGVAMHVIGRSFWDVFVLPGPIFWVCFVGLCVYAWVILARALNPIDEFNQKDWLGFDNINVDKGMDDVVGKYAEEIGYWKSRLDH